MAGHINEELNNKTDNSFDIKSIISFIIDIYVIESISFSH